MAMAMAWWSHSDGLCLVGPCSLRDIDKPVKAMVHAPQNISLRVSKQSPVPACLLLPAGDIVYYWRSACPDTLGAGVQSSICGALWFPSVWCFLICAMTLRDHSFFMFSIYDSSFEILTVIWSWNEEVVAVTWRVRWQVAIRRYFFAQCHRACPVQHKYIVLLRHICLGLKDGMDFSRRSVRSDWGISWN